MFEGISLIGESNFLTFVAEVGTGGFVWNKSIQNAKETLQKFESSPSSSERVNKVKETKKLDKERNNSKNTGNPSKKPKSQLKKVFDVADNYTLHNRVNTNHILERHGSNTNNPAFANKSKFNSDFDIRAGIDSTLKGNGVLVKQNTFGREGYIFEQTFRQSIGIKANGRPVSTLKVVIDKNGNVITAFPKK